MPTPYQPPFTLTPRQLMLVAEICEWLGRWGGGICRTLRTEPGSPRGPTQRYRLTDAGRRSMT